MDYEKQILDIANKNNGIVTTKLVTENKIARIYINKLLEKNSLFKVDRGVYSTTKQKIDTYYTFQNKSKKIIYSHFTSLKIQGIYKNIDKEEQISVNQGYNCKNISGYKIFYNNENNYQAGLIEYTYNGCKIKIYDVERSVCDIIKDRNRFDESEYNKFINFYFNKNNLNYKKLLEYSTKLGVSELVHHYLSLFKA